MQVRPWDISNSYLHGAVDLRTVEHELEVVEAAQGGLPGHVFPFIDQEEGVVQRQSDGELSSTGDKQEAPGQHSTNPATLWGPWARFSGTHLHLHLLTLSYFPWEKE